MNLITEVSIIDVKDEITPADRKTIQQGHLDSVQEWRASSLVAEGIRCFSSMLIEGEQPELRTSCLTDPYNSKYVLKCHYII